MTILYPDYKDRFRCLAGACPDSCCMAWEIVVDPDTVSLYRGVPGKLGEKLRRSLATDKDGDAYFPLADGRCPFLRPDGLCEIHAALGDAATSAVCRQFPDFIEEYEGFTERCPSPACPAAAELIFAEPLTDDVYPAPPPSEDGLPDLLIRGRTAALRTAAACGTFAESAARIWAMAQDLQEIADNFDPRTVVYDFGAVPADAAYADGAEEYATWMAELTERCLRFLREDAEILTEEWRGLLEKALTRPEPAAKPAEEADLRRVLRYFLYRYFLKPVNDGEILLWTAFILLSAAVCGAVAERTGTDFRTVARLYSKEIEHDTENVEALLEFLSFEY